MNSSRNRFFLVFTCVSQIVEGNKVVGTNNYVVISPQKTLPCLEIEGGKSLDWHYQQLVSDITEYSSDYIYKKLVDCQVRHDGGIDVYMTVSLNITNHSGFNRLKYINLDYYELFDIKDLGGDGLVNFDREIVLRSLRR